MNICNWCEGRKIVGRLTPDERGNAVMVDAPCGRCRGTGHVVGTACRRAESFAVVQRHGWQFWFGRDGRNYFRRGTRWLCIDEHGVHAVPGDLMVPYKTGWRPRWAL